MKETFKICLVANEYQKRHLVFHDSQVKTDRASHRRETHDVET